MKIIILLCLLMAMRVGMVIKMTVMMIFQRAEFGPKLSLFHMAMFNPPFSMQHGIVIIIIVLKSTYPKVFQLANVFWKLLQAILVKVEHLQQFGQQKKGLDKKIIKLFLQPRI